jgi:hypothetical protein
VLVAKTTKRGERVQCMRVRYWHQFFIGISLITLQGRQKWYLKPFPNEFHGKRKGAILYLGMDKQKTRRSGALTIAWVFQNQFNSRHSSLKRKAGRISEFTYFQPVFQSRVHSFGPIMASKHK